MAQRFITKKSALLAAAASMLVAAPAWAQDAQPGTSPQATDDEVPSGGDIIVTARKRSETSIAVPVVITAVGGAELERRGVNSLDGLARLVPALIIGDASGSLQGGNVAIRGIGGADNNPLGDQAVSFNIDGVQIARSTVRRMSEMDIAQVEVLKGPQALFFGKNSPGGIISVRSADPTDTFAAKLSTGYEFNANEWRTDGFISAPITDSLGVRLAASTSQMDGWLTRLVPDGSPYAPRHKNAPHMSDYAGRLTLLYDDGGPFNARLKLSYHHVQGDGNYSGQQFIDCPLGAPQPLSAAIVNDCKADGRTTTGDSGPTFAAVLPQFGDGRGRNKQNQMLGSLEMNYDILENVTLTSVTGYYDTFFNNVSNFTTTYAPSRVSAVYFRLDIREFNQELRLTSDFDGPVNFTFGGFYQNSKAEDEIRAYLFPVGTVTGTSLLFKQKGTTYSAFGQLRWQIVPTVEFAAGGRYSSETKKLPYVALGQPLMQVNPTINEAKFDDFSPEATLSWRPNTRFTLFGAYKRGFLSGGFNTSSTTFGPEIVYQPETVKGFEVGAKALILDDRLRTNLSLYRYKISDLQVSTAVNTLIQLRNATSSTVKGAEFDFNYRTPLEGFNINGAVAYTHARYGAYFATCWGGQPQPACQVRLNPSTGVSGLSQDLSGAQLVRAPDWSGNLGFSYDTPIGGLKLGVTGNMTFTSGFFTDAANKPGGRQDAYQLFDATLRIGDLDDRWELALIGKNLTNKYYYTRSLDNPLSGAGTGGPAASAVTSDTASIVARPREIMLRATIRFGQ